MHVYLFWRLTSIPTIKRHIPRKILIGAGLSLWIIFWAGRFIGHGGTGPVAGFLEFIGMTWMAILFLTFSLLFSVDLLTLFGFLLQKISTKLRGLAVATGIVFSAVALFQGLRLPAVEKYQIYFPGLPDTLEGKVIVALSDMHLDSQTGKHWLEAIIDQVNEQQPDLIVMLGDIFEGHSPPDNLLIKTLKQLSAPFGIWAVPGNHEFYGKGVLNLFNDAGFNLLRNRWVEVIPGLVLAGVDDLTVMRRKNKTSDPISQALKGRSHEAFTILLSHTPWQTEKASKNGVGLMLCGHTHGGQIWPFDYFVSIRYPLLEGHYDVNGMVVIVCRGTGTWGPRMRLWQPGEILHVTLRKK
jgi:predicted MPP superfamily phosphohydrolase